jgi:hypothetical protein
MPCSREGEGLHLPPVPDALNRYRTLSAPANDFLREAYFRFGSLTEVISGVAELTGSRGSTVP